MTKPALYQGTASAVPQADQRLSAIAPVRFAAAEAGLYLQISAAE